MEDCRITLDKAPSRPFDSCRHQQSRRSGPSPHETRSSLDSENTTARHLRCPRRCQHTDKVVGVEIGHFIREFAFRLFRPDAPRERLDV